MDCLFIAGDLFHRQPLLRDLKEVNYLFSTIPQTQVVIIAGNHDRIRKNSAVLSFSWASNVTFLESEDVSSVYFEDINTEVTAFLTILRRSRSRASMLLKRRRMEKSTFCWGTAATRTTSRSTGRRWLPLDFRISHWGTSTGQRSYWTKDGILRFPGAA